MADFFTGYRLDVEIAQGGRENVRAMSRPLGFTLRDFDPPEEIDHRGWYRIENQGSMGSCRGQCRAGGAEVTYRYATGGAIAQFSAMWCYLQAQRFGGLLGADQGSTIEGGVKAALEVGHCPEDVFPYPQPVRYSTRIPQGAAEAAEIYKAGSSTWIESAEEAYTFLAGQCGTIDVGAPWPLPFGNDFILRDLRGGCGGGGGHAWPILGYLKELGPDGKPLFTAPNSWGRDWGREGWMFLTWTAVDQMLRRQDVCMAAISHLTVPKPAGYDFLTDGVC